MPPVASLRELFSQYLDFNAVPRRSFFQFLRYFTADEMERERLDEFLSPQGAVGYYTLSLYLAYKITKDDLYEYCFRVKRTIREVLTEFRNVKIPKEYIFDVFPSLRSREFSIASSVKVIFSPSGASCDLFGSSRHTRGKFIFVWPLSSTEQN